MAYNVTFKWDWTRRMHWVWGHTASNFISSYIFPYSMESLLFTSLHGLAVWKSWSYLYRVVLIRGLWTWWSCDHLTKSRFSIHVSFREIFLKHVILPSGRDEHYALRCCKQSHRHHSVHCWRPSDERTRQRRPRMTSCFILLFLYRSYNFWKII